jgi:hypothetical protein
MTLTWTHQYISSNADVVSTSGQHIGEEEEAVDNTCTGDDGSTSHV